MANEAPPRPLEPDLPRERPSAEDGGLLATLEASRTFRPALLAVTATAVGLLLAPQWVSRSFPTDPSLIGTPASEDIKAEYDDRGDIIDEATTSRLRDDAVDTTLRIFEWESGVGARLAAQVHSATDAARRALIGPSLGDALPIDNGPEAPLDPKRVTAARDALEAELGLEIPQGAADKLARWRYPESFAVLLAGLVEDALSQPVVADSSELESDQGRGIVIRGVLADGSAPRRVLAVETVPDVGQVRSSLAARFARLVAAHSATPDQFEPTAIQEKKRAAEPGSDGLPPALEPTLLAVARDLVRPTLRLDRRRTELARADAMLSVPPVKLTVRRGEMIIRDGEMYTERHLLVLRAMETYGRHASFIMVGLGATLLVVILTLAGLSTGRRPGRFSRLSARDGLFLASLLIVAVVAARVWIAVGTAVHETYPTIPLQAFLFALPIAAGTLTTRLVLRLEPALIFGVISSVALGLMMEGERLIIPYALVGAVLGATMIGNITSRGDLMRAGLRVGGGQAIMAVSILLFSADGVIVDYLFAVVAAFVGGLISAFAALAITPAIEALFGYTSDLKLLELANLNHPALKELIVQAPGTYHHSIIVGSLVEAAAEEIGANPLLAKVMAYYHDLGKGCNALYFIENQRGGHNPHDKLKPSMSAMVVRRHVTDGLEIARRYRLGEQIRAAIAEHHGTTLIQFFYAKAKEQAEPDTVLNESDYRYVGRKPQTRETALVMLGDSVEAASRSLPDPTPARLKGLVTRIINVKFTDGQLEECDLTLANLHRIARAFIRVLDSIYHSRVEYPELSQTGKNKDGDSDPKPPPANGGDDTSEADRPDNIRRLGLSGH